jgi:hypothetical protein
MGEMREGIFWTHHIKAHGFDPETPIQAELDIMKEKAEALGRVGGRLDESLRGMKILEKRIQMLEREGQRGRVAVNTLIGEFNQVRQRALRYLHYLIIQREAMGFRRHTHVTAMYQIPPRKRPFPLDDVREEHSP